MKADAELQGYLDEAASWDRDRAEVLGRRLKVAWGIAVFASVCALVSGVGLTMLVPLKTVVPYLVRVETTTGVVDTVPEVRGAVMSETITRYLLTHYVLTCLRFISPEVAESDYFECGSFHSAKMNAAWAAKWDTNNPESPLRKYGETASSRVQVSSITFLKVSGGEVAQVRYLTVETRAGIETVVHWIATVSYAYGSPSEDAKRRQWNPLGFKILDFRPELEVSGPEGKRAAGSGSAS
jgi:type IV secretion system protein VirB8